LETRSAIGREGRPRIFWRGGARRYAILWVFLSLVYHSNLRPVASGDSLPAALIPFSILLDHSMTLDRFGPYLRDHVWYAKLVTRQVGGHWYSVYPIGGPVLATPLYVPVVCVPWVRRQDAATLVAVARIAEKFVAVALAAAAAVLLLALLRRMLPEREAWLMTLVFALGTGNWSTASQALWQHTYGEVAILGCLYAIDRWEEGLADARWEWVAGFCAGCALTIRPSNIALPVALAVVLSLRRTGPRTWIRVFAPVTGAGALTAASNLAVFGRVSGGYPPSLGGHFLEGLAGVLFSPGRGLLVYTPVAVFALAALFRRARESGGRHRMVIAAAGVFSVCDIGIVAFWPAWWGGYCWGPRLLTDILAPLMILVAAGLPALRGSGWKWAFTVAVVYGLVIQAIGVYCYPEGRWDRLPVSVDSHPERLWDWKDNPIARTVRGGIASEPYAVVEAAARGGWTAAARKLRELGISPY
jgi:hypothetical protein